MGPNEVIMDFLQLIYIEHTDIVRTQPYTYNDAESHTSSECSIDKSHLHNTEDW